MLVKHGGGVSTGVASAGKNFKIRIPYKRHTRQFYYSSKKVKADKIVENVIQLKMNPLFFTGFTDGKVVYTSLLLKIKIIN